MTSVSSMWIAVQFLIPLLCAPTWAQSVHNEGQARLDTLWVNAPPSNLPSNDVGLPLSLIDLAQLPNGSAALLVSDSNKSKALFLEANEQGPGRFIPLAHLAAVPGSGLRLIAGGANHLWIGGASNHRESMFGGHSSAAYLANFDGQGALIWDRAFDDNNAKEIQDMTALPNGDVVVAGKVDNQTWLARISGDAQIVWQRSFALGRVAAVATVGDRIVVAAFDADGEGIWRFTDEGKQVDHFIIDKADQPPHPFWLVRLFSDNSNDAFYALSLWSETFQRQETLLAHPLRVLKVDAHGRTVWRQELSQAGLQGLDVADPALKGPPEFCMPVIGLLPNNNPLIACPARGALIVSEINSLSGELNQFKASRSPSSPCATGRSWPNLIVPKSDKMIFLFGTGKCTWLEQVSLTP